MKTSFLLKELGNETWNDHLFSWTRVEHSVTKEK